MAASGDVMLTTAQQTALMGVLPMNGDSVTLDVGADGVMRAGVTFTCMSDYPCTVTVSNSAGTIVAMWASQTLGDGMASAMATGLEPPPDAFPRMNPANGATVAGILRAGIDTAASGVGVTPVTPRGPYSGSPNVVTTTDAANATATVLGGLGLGDSGAANIDGITITSDLDPNTPFTAGVASGAALAGSSMSMTDETMDNRDSVAIDGWTHKVLFRDWGDTAGTGDGGFETGALVYSDMMDPVSAPFDRNLAAMFVNAGAQNSFRLHGIASGTVPANPGANTSVVIDPSGTYTTTGLTGLLQAGSAQLLAMRFDADSLVGAQDQDLNIDASETFTGSYFGAPGQFRCVAASCALRRNADGTVGVADTNAATAGTQSTGTWTFTPDPGAMVAVPDQDWMIYGAWLTTPDVMSGTHRVGVFFSGMAPYTRTFAPGGTPFGLTGSATYSGGATGVYVDGTRSGLFTAAANLTATFDVNGNGTDDATTDFMVSGRIDNFKDSAGRFLGADTAANPNDPVAGGENDWVVLLGTADLAAITTGSIPLPAAGTTNTSGSADGFGWTGRWSGQFYGPNTNAAGNNVVPTGVGGQFEAITGATVDTDPTTAGVQSKGVVGAFGATLD